MKDTDPQSKLIHPLEIYLEHLATINNIPLSQREIDVISCLLNGRNTKGIANFLSIAPKTVATHIYNATKRFGCGSDGMKTLIENSDRFLALKEYYLALLVDNLFKKSLKEISTQVIDTHTLLKSVLVFWQKKPPFLESLQADLIAAGLTISLESRKESQSFPQLMQEIYHDTCPIYFLSDILMENQQTQQVTQEVDQSSDARVFFLPKMAKPMATPQEISRFTFVNPSEWSSYYFSVFVILKKILPVFGFDEIFARFEEKAYTLKSSSFLPPVQSSPSSPNVSEADEKQGSHSTESIELALEPEKTNHSGKEAQFFTGAFPRFFLAFWRQLRWKWLAGSFLTFIMMLIFYFIGFYSIGTKFHLEIQNMGSHRFHTVRSEIILPTADVLLSRVPLLKKIDETFRHEPKGLKVIVLVGAGGAGKTTLARHYAQSQKAQVVWEIPATTKASLYHAFRDLAYALSQTPEAKSDLEQIQKISNSAEQEKRLLFFVKKHLKEISSWFLIYDNVETLSEIKDFIPLEQEVMGNRKSNPYHS